MLGQSISTEKVWLLYYSAYTDYWDYSKNTDYFSFRYNIIGNIHNVFNETVAKNPNQKVKDVFGLVEKNASKSFMNMYVILKYSTFLVFDDTLLCCFRRWEPGKYDSFNYPHMHHTKKTKLRNDGRPLDPARSCPFSTELDPYIQEVTASLRIIDGRLHNTQFGQAVDLFAPAPKRKCWFPKIIKPFG